MVAQSAEVIFAQPLREWILADKSHGTLAPFAGDMMLWDVPDENLARIGKELMDAGRVFDYMRDIVSKWPPVQPTSIEQAAGTVAQAFGFESPEEVDVRKGDKKKRKERS